MKWDARRSGPAVTTAILGGVYLFLTWRHQPVPPMLNQALIAAAGSLFAGTALAGAIPKPKDQKPGPAATT